MDMIRKSKDVVILLSTYNGERYLSELLDSLLNQSYTNVDIIIRDDGSVDNTKIILRRYEELYKSIKVVYGENIGVIKSFFKLLEIAKGYKYYSFCDQDDVWLKDKICKAIECISTYDSEEPLLYCSNVTIVDQKLNITGEPNKKHYKPSFSNSLLQNIATGCTILINEKSRSYLLKEVPEGLRMHDWWMYQVISCVGTVVFDYNSYILYRQHSSNTVGAHIGMIDFWMNRLHRFKNNKTLPFIMHHANELKRIHENEIPFKNRKILYNFLGIQHSIFKRVSYVFSSNTHRQESIDNILFKFLIIFKKI